MKEKFDIKGMSCAACAAGIDKKVRKMDGVHDLGVDLIGESMWVEFDDKKTSADSIINTVEKIGFKAYLKENRETPKITKEEENNSLPSEKIRLIYSIPLMILVFYLAMGPMFKFPMPEFFMLKENAGVMSLTQLILTIPVLFLNRKYYIQGFKALKNKVPNMDSLVAISSLASFLFSLFYTFLSLYYLSRDIDAAYHYTHALYYDSATMILTLVTVGKYLEAKSKRQTKASLESLINLAPKEAILLRENEEVKIPATEIKENDILIIKPGAKIPVDGEVIEGISSVEESALTGEPVPQEKSQGSQVYQGTANTSGLLKIKALKVGEDTQLSQIVKLMEDTRASKAPIARLADKVSGIFVPVVMGISILSFIIWMIVTQDFAFSLKIAISVLVISCPCALGLATPVAITVAVGRLSKEGVLIKNAETLENLHKISAVALDKTGTLTLGKPAVKEIYTNNIEKREFLKIAASLEKPSSHPLALAVEEYAKDIELFEIKNFSQIAGRGVKGSNVENTFYGGNFAYMTELGIEVPKYSGTVMYFAKDRDYLGALIVKDNLKAEAEETISNLKNQDISIFLLTGDSQGTANEIKDKLNLKDAIGGLFPKDKAEYIEKLQKNGEKVLFTGDGINDAPAITQADIGVAVNNGTDIAIESADIVIMNDNLKLVPRMLSYSKETIKIIKQNLFFAFIYNVIGIPIAAGVFYPVFGLLLSPMIGAICMAMSSISVNLNALRLAKK